MKNITAVSVLAALLACMSVGAVSFEKIQTYTADTFADVSPDAWYAADVAGSFEMGLMKGTGGNRFEPEGNVTVAEAITMASRVSAVYTGETIPEIGGEWYDMYVAYAVAHGFVKQGQFDAYDVPAARAEVASMFAKALPEAEYAVKNDVTLIPDVPENMPCFADVLRLYKAGIVMGSDDAGTFNPYTSITRAEAAAILNRVAVSEKRLTKSLRRTSSDDAYLLMKSSGFNAGHEGIASGWQLDNRGGVPRTDLLANYGALQDIRTDAGAAYIHPFNDISTGVLTLNTVIASSGDGAYIAFTNQNGENVLYLETIDGKWQIKTTDGFVPLADVTPDRGSMTFGAVMDIDNAAVDVYFDGKSCGSYPTLTSNTVLSAFRFGTTKEGTPSFAPGKVMMTVNFAVYDEFAFENGTPSLLRDAVNADVEGERLKLGKNGRISKTFRPIGGKTVGEFNFISDRETPVTFTLSSADSAVAVFTTDDKAFYVNGTAVYPDYVDGLWYRVRLELDPVSCGILVKINGRKTEEVPFAVKAASIDGVSLVNGGEKTVTADDFRVFRLIEHDDYVPVPVAPKGDNRYTIGMNVCSLWQEGYHFGWSCITPFDDVKPVLGYYDEGNPETADWEIKYLVEHGIDFQAFCVFFGYDSPKKLESQELHLFNGFMNAKYSDMTHYCIIFEAGDAQSPYSLDEWKKDYVPYLIENFFKDTRYQTVDNKPVMCVFGWESFANRLKSDETSREAFDYLEEEVKKLGFDGMIYLACGTSSPRLAALGYDGCYAYSWGREGYTTRVNMDSMTVSADEGSVYQVPTVSVGFNDVGWSGVRQKLMTVEDYRTVHEWVRDTYLPERVKEPWQKNLVMLSTWNEYGEGTYIMPSGLNGFGYIDTVRKVYTDEKDNASDPIPTASQLSRIARMYPQKVRLLRKEGYYANEVHEEEQDVVAVIDYRTQKGVGVSQSENIRVTDEGLCFTTADLDPTVYLPQIDGDLFAMDVKAMRLSIQAPKGTLVEIFYTTSESGALSQSKSTHFTTDTDEMKSYVVMTEGLPYWSGVIKGIRVDPGYEPDCDICLKSLEFLRDRTLPVVRTVTVNGMTFESSFAPAIASNNDVLLAFEPALGMDFRLALYHTWDKENGTLTLMNKDHTLVFTVGGSAYVCDGKTVELPYVIGQTDGIPLIPINRVCAELGYDYKLVGDEIHITTYESEYYASKTAARKEGAFEFESVGDTEGFTSGAMTLVVEDGFMRCKSSAQTNDPTLLNTDGISLRAMRYNAFEIRVRYEYEASAPDVLQMYFVTNKDGFYSESKAFNARLKSTDSNGEWETYTIDLTKCAGWQDTITALRFDPFNAVGTMDIDYMRFIEDPAYDPMLDVEEEEVIPPLSIHNGDAESTGGFESGGNIRILEDDNGNHYFMNLPNNDEEIWLYAIQYVKFRPGATYSASVDVRLASLGTDTDRVGNANSTLCCNPQYEGVDHIVSRISLNGGEWQHWEFTFEIDPNSKDRSMDRFTIYSNPMDGTGVGFCFDNLVVKEIEKE